MMQIESTQAHIGARLNSIDTLTLENESLSVYNASTIADSRHRYRRGNFPAGSATDQAGGRSGRIYAGESVESV